MKIRPLFAVLISLLFITPVTGTAQKLGPVKDYVELVRYTDEAEDGDTVFVSGKVQADETSPLTSRSQVNITSSEEARATVAGLHLQDAQISFSNISLTDSLTIEGSSHVMLASDVDVTGGSGPAIDFKGNGELIIDPSCTVTGTGNNDGISIEHSGGSLYAAIEGNVSGGSDYNGGNGVTVSPLQSEGLLLIGGEITGGEGNDIGGNAVNLYDISGNAYISITGNMKGGEGIIGGDGVQIISAQDTTNIGVLGTIEGGKGDDFGGNAVLVMNVTDNSAITLSGELIGGKSTAESSDPGQSLLLIGNGAINHIYDNNCFLEDGQIVPNEEPVSEEIIAEEVVADDVSTEEVVAEGVEIEEETVSADVQQAADNEHASSEETSSGDQSSNADENTKGNNQQDNESKPDESKEDNVTDKSSESDSQKVQTPDETEKSESEATPAESNYVSEATASETH